jgi:MFS-type transporter involved in bile tolerance (Atg22 family)
MNNKFNVRLSWSFYDWANSAWSAIIITFIFSRYFVDVIAPDKDLGTLYWTWTIGISKSLSGAMTSTKYLEKIKVMIIADQAEFAQS